MFGEILYEQYKETATSKGYALSFEDISVISSHRAEIAALLPFHKESLYALNPASFDFLTIIQRKQLKEKLLFTFNLLYNQFQLDLAEGRDYLLKKHADDINHCSKMLERLEISLDPNHTEFEKQLAIESSFSDKYLQFMGFCFVSESLRGAIQDFIDTPTRTTKTWMSEVNGLRLEWVWDGSFISSILDRWISSAIAADNLKNISPYTGTMSWALYYFRFAIELFTLVKHVVWPSDAEAKIPVMERFLTQWNQRKFAILNDLIWATANLLCFFILKGSGILGYWGNILTAGLLIMDLCLLIWKMAEEDTKHNKIIADWEAQRSYLQDKLYDNLSEEEKKQIREQIVDIDKMIRKKKFEWKYERYGMIKDIAYAIGLLTAFAIMCCFFFPPAAVAPALILTIGFVGAALCFIVTTAAAVIGNVLEYRKLKETYGFLQEDWDKDLGKFKKLTEQMATPREGKIDENYQKALLSEQKLIYLDLKKNLVDSDFQERTLRMQKVKIVRDLIIDIALPTSMFFAIFGPVFVPLIVIGVILALIFVTKLIVDYYEPKAEEFPDFNEEQFNAFVESTKPGGNPKEALQGIIALEKTEKAAKTAKVDKEKASGHEKEKQVESALLEKSIFISCKPKAKETTSTPITSFTTPNGSK